MQSTDWSARPTRQRCRMVAAVAREVCRRSDELIDACRSDQRTDPVETITSELIPWCAALKWIGKHGPGTLASRKEGMLGRPAWLLGVHSEVQRVPIGEVLVLGTWNYPLLLPGVQAAQALAAGNRVQLKPAAGTEAASQLLAECFWDSGIPREQLQLLAPTTQAAVDAIERGVDLIVLTGAAETGRKVLAASASKLSASIMELSGCDAVVILPGYDADRVNDALKFGLKFNGSATCIAPRRLFADPETLDRITLRLLAELKEEPPAVVHPAARHSVAESIENALRQGARDMLGRFDAEKLRERGELFPVLLGNVKPDDKIAQSDIFAPVISMISIADTGEAIRCVNQCPYRLAASVFGPRADATRVAQSLDVGTVTINDLIAPTADPRLPFGGRGQSGFGVTRGKEGLLAMTAVKVISCRRGKIAPHLMPRKSGDEEMLHGAMHFFYGGKFLKRLAGLRRMIRGVK